MKPLKAIASIALTFAAGGIGSLATTRNIPTWYAGLEKPFFNPPNWVFGPVWTTLYVLIGISLYLIWTSTSKKPKSRAYRAYGVQLVLNTAWSLVFFGLQQPWAAVVIIVALIVSIIWMMRAFQEFSGLARNLLIPYLAWVSFATLLNIAVAVLN